MAGTSVAMPTMTTGAVAQYTSNKGGPWQIVDPNSGLQNAQSGDQYTRNYGGSWQKVTPMPPSGSTPSTVGGSISTPTPNMSDVQKQMAQNSAAYKTATLANQANLHLQNMRLGTSIGGKYDASTGQWTFPSTPMPPSAPMGGVAPVLTPKMTPAASSSVQQQTAVPGMNSNNIDSRNNLIVPGYTGPQIDGRLNTDFGPTKVTPLSNPASGQNRVPVPSTSSAPPTSGGSTPGIPTPQQSAQAWINNPSSKEGGMDAYVKSQNARYVSALASGDTTTANKLTADAQRVGYTLNAPTPQMNSNVQSSNNNGGQSGTPVPGMNSTNGNNGGNAGSSTFNLTPAQITTEAQSRIAQLRQGLVDSANTSEAAATDAFKYNNQVTQDNRTLSNAEFNENNNPFSGKFEYDKTNILRNNDIQDQATQADYANQMAGYAQPLAAFDASAPGQEQQIEDQLGQQNFTNNATAAALTGQFNGAPTLQAQGQKFDQGITQAGVTGQYNGQNTMQQNQNNNSDAIAQAGVTGIYNPSGQSADQIQAQMDKNSKAYATATPAQQIDLHNQNLALAALLGKSYDSATGTYSGGTDQVGTPTLQAKGQEFNQNMAKKQFDQTVTQQQIQNGQWSKTFDEQMKEWAAGQKLDWTKMNLDTKSTLAQIAISQQNADTSRQNANTTAANDTARVGIEQQAANNSVTDTKQTQLMNVWKASGVAPVGIPGVPPGAPYAGSSVQQTHTNESKWATRFDALPAGQQVSAVESNKAAIVKELGQGAYNSMHNTYLKQSEKSSTDLYNKTLSDIQANHMTKAQALAYLPHIEKNMTPSDYRSMSKYINANLQ